MRGMLWYEDVYIDFGGEEDKHYIGVLNKIVEEIKAPGAQPVLAGLEDAIGAWGPAAATVYTGWAA
jgi:hypothetical protein